MSFKKKRRRYIAIIPLFVLWIVISRSKLENCNHLDSIKEFQSFEEITPKDLLRPFVVRSINSSALINWNLQWLAESPRGDLLIDYFSDARKTPERGGLVPDAKKKLKVIAHELSQKNSTVKLATEKIIRKFPHLLLDLPLDSIRRALGAAHFQLHKVGYTLTAPIFIGNAGGRTDLHAEPIANLAFQLQGAKRWLLIPPHCLPFHHIMLPVDGRAYLASRLHPDAVVSTLPSTHSLTLFSGDALFVPTFYWHRVDYYNNDTACPSSPTANVSFSSHDEIDHQDRGGPAIGISLFHFRPRQLFFSSGPYPRAFFLLLLPNILKEVIGWKTQ